MQIGNYCAEQLNKAKIKVHAPQGGFYLFLDFSRFGDNLFAADIKTSDELCSRLLAETGVAILPASAFGFDKDYFAARLAYVDFKEPKKTSNFNLKSDCQNIVEGIELICSWIENI